MSFTYPADQESGANPRNYTRMTLLRCKARYRSLVGDSNAANKCPLIVEGAPSQTENLIEVYNSSRAGLYAVDPNGNVVQGGVLNLVQCVTQVTLTAAQIATLNSVPVSLVAAPGAGIALIAQAMIFQFKYGSVQFTTSTGTTQPVYHGATTNLLAGAIAASTIKGSANAIISLGGPATALAVSTNTGIDLETASADFSGSGDSTAIATLFYDQLTLG